MRIFVISLISSEDRREYMKQEMGKHVIAFEFFDAIKIKNRGELDNYDWAYREKFFGRQMSNGEIGCYLSHLTLWRKCVELNETICIIEDDVRIVADDFNGAVAKLASVLDVDIIKIGGVFPRKFFNYKKVGNIQLVKYWFDNMGTQGYIITPAAAKVLIQNFTKIKAPVDDCLANYATHGLNIVAVEPKILEHLDVGSLLNDKDPKKKLPPLNKVRREVYLQTKRILNLIFQIKWFIKVNFKKLY